MTDYREDSLYVSEDTSVDEIIDWLKRCTDEPIKVGNKTVWNFSSHTVDEELLREKVEQLKRDEFVIPFQVAGTWAFMFNLLPDRLKRAEVLVFNKRDETYYAYRNFYRDLTVAEMDGIEHDLKERVYDAEEQEEIRQIGQPDDS